MLLNDIINGALAATLVLTWSALASEASRGQRAIKKGNRPAHNEMPITGFQTMEHNQQPVGGYVRGPRIQRTNGIDPTEEDVREYKRLSAEEYAKTGYRLSSLLVFGNIIDTIDPQRMVDDAGWAKKHTAELLVIVALILSDEGYDPKTDPVDEYKGDKFTSKDPSMRQLMEIVGEVLGNCKSIDSKKFAVNGMPENIAKIHPQMADQFAAVMADAQKRVTLERNAGIAALQKAFPILMKAHARYALKQLGWTRRDLIPHVEKLLTQETSKDEDVPYEQLLLWARATHEFSASFKGIMGAAVGLKEQADLVTPESKKTDQVTQAELNAIQADGTWPWIKDTLGKTLVSMEGLDEKQNKQISQLKVARLIQNAASAEFTALSRVLDDYEKNLELRISVEIQKRTQGEEVEKEMARHSQEINNWIEQGKLFGQKIAAGTAANFPNMNFIEAWTRHAQPLYNIMQCILVRRMRSEKELGLLYHMLKSDKVETGDSLDSDGISVPGSDEGYDSDGTSIDSDSILDESDDDIEPRYRLPKDVRAVAKLRITQLERLSEVRQQVFRTLRDIFHQATSNSLGITLRKLEQDERDLKDLKPTNALIPVVQGQKTDLSDGPAVTWFDLKRFILDRSGTMREPNAADLRKQMQRIRFARKKSLNDDLAVYEPASLDANVRRYLEASVPNGLDQEKGPDAEFVRPSSLSLLERVRVDRAVAKMFKDSAFNLIRTGDEYVKQLYQKEGISRDSMRNSDKEDPSDMLRSNFEEVAKTQESAINNKLTTLGNELFGMTQTTDESRTLDQEIKLAIDLLKPMMTQDLQAIKFIDTQLAKPTLATPDVAELILRQMFAITRLAETHEITKKASSYISAFAQAAPTVQLGSNSEWKTLSNMADVTKNWKEWQSRYLRKASQVSQSIKTTISSTQEYLANAKAVVKNPAPMYNEPEEPRMKNWDELYERRQGIVQLKAIVEYFGNHPVTRLDWAKKDREEMIRGLEGLLKTIEDIRIFLKGRFPAVNGQKRLTKHRFDQVQFNENSELAQYKKNIEQMADKADRWHYQFPSGSQFAGARVPQLDQQ